VDVRCTERASINGKKCARTMRGPRRVSFAGRRGRMSVSVSDGGFYYVGIHVKFVGYHGV
jgi:hypothetical protein